MREITLTNRDGMNCQVSDEDFALVSSFNWMTREKRNFYAFRKERKGGKQKTIWMHRFILGEPPDGQEVDHVDGNGLNNQRSNLRFVSRRQNCQNLHTNKTSAFPGVSWDKSPGKWKATIKINRKPVHLGCFSNENDAFAAYREAVEATGDTVIS